MSEETPVYWKSAKLFPRFYDSIAEALLGGECPRIGKFKFGYGYIDDSTAEPTLLDVPDGLTDIPNVLFEGTPDLTYSDGRILVRCHMPQASLDKPHQYSMTGIYDTKNNLIAVTNDLPAWLVPSTRHTTYSYIDFPHVSEDAPEIIDGGKLA